ncbi:unnamed protein product [Toxocara canis]|uniref:Ion_trans_2 domain-containing protein n=1 Tax=Toxocara canis TaxID=6265 RepID=A0A183UX50_TOXCA|nr:unnamed protein product [Toxocara canis]
MEVLMEDLTRMFPSLGHSNQKRCEKEKIELYVFPFFTVVDGPVSRTKVTVGFGDLVPVGGEHYVAASILFIFLGLVLMTLAVDVIGSSCIEKIHAWGRGLDALNLLNALRNHNQQCWFAYVPKDAHLIPFIDCTDTSNKD